MRVQEHLSQPFPMHLLTYTPPPDLLDSEDPDTDEINCVNSRVRSIPDLRLERFPQVQRLRLRQNLIQRIEGLSVLAGTLTDIEFYDNLISHISGLDDLTNLTSLDLSYNKIKHIKNVNHLVNLTDLFFVSNKISRIEGLDGLNQLRNLELASNRIRKLENLDALPALEQLWLASNKITELTGLGALTNLRLLSVQSNRIRDLSPLKELPQLEELYMSHNGLESLEGIENNTKLRVLEISNNQITNLKALVPLVELEDVWASYNQISDFSDVEQALADKKALTTVYFEGNPLQLKSPALYRNKVKMALPQIQQIDASMCPPSPPCPLTQHTNSRSVCTNIMKVVISDPSRVPRVSQVFIPAVLSFAFCGDLQGEVHIGQHWERLFITVHRTAYYVLAFLWNGGKEGLEVTFFCGQQGAIPFCIICIHNGFVPLIDYGVL